MTGRKTGQADVGRSKTVGARAPVASNDLSHVENKAPSHLFWGDEAPVPPALLQPSPRGEPSESPPSCVAALRKVRELLARPPASGEHDAWAARVRELTDAAGGPPEGRTTAGRTPRQAKRYYVLEGDLLQQRSNGVGLRCIPSEEGAELLKDIHKGDCGHLLSPRALAEKVLRHGLYWPTALEDAAKLIETCEEHRPFCAYHQTSTHTTADCIYLKKLRDERLAGNSQEGLPRANSRRSAKRSSNSHSKGRRDEPYLYAYGGGFNDIYYGGGYGGVYGGYYQLQPQQLQQPYFAPTF